MPNYIYSGPPKKYTYSKKRNSALLDKATLLIFNSRPFKNKKSNESPLLYPYKKSKMLSYYYDAASLLAKECEIILVCGHNFIKMVKECKNSSVKIAENKMYAYSNDMEDLRIGMNLCCDSPVFIADPCLVPSIRMFEECLNTKKSCMLTYNCELPKIGVIKNTENDILEFSYGSNEKVLGITKIINEDVNRIKIKLHGSAFRANKFMYEIFGNVKVEAIKTTSRIIRIDES